MPLPRSTAMRQTILSVAALCLSIALTTTCPANCFAGAFLPRPQKQPPAATPADARSQELALKPKIDAAIESGVESLFESQYRDGSWGMHGDFVGGRAGLCLYTLLQCGVSREHPSVRRAVAYLDTCDPGRTYATACMILALDALRDGREERIEQLVRKLIEWQRPEGDWAYPQGARDLSCTQYAALGMWVGQKRGFDIDQRVWRKLLEAVGRYRCKVHMIDNPRRDGRTGAAKIESSGYSYRPYNDKEKPTGSMTSAAIAVMQICKAGLGRKMRRQSRNSSDRMTESALTWLSQNFAVDRNPNGGHEHYYLYGLERIGALLQTEQIGPHWWYVEGAKHLVSTQNKKGNWGGVHDTCFSLLFLRRATASAPTTGGMSQNRHSFSSGIADADIRLRGAGQQPLSMWIDGFGKPLQELHSEFGVRVISVEYLDQKDRVLAKVAGDPTKTWRSETFLYRDKAVSRGEHQIRARITLLANDAEPGATGPTEEIYSSPMAVKIRDVFEPWMKEGVAGYTRNLLRDRKLTISTSSSLDDKHPGQHLVDGLDSKAWIASPDDKEPWAELRWKKAVRVGSILFTRPAQHEEHRKRYDEIEAIEVCIGSDKDRWLRIDANQDPLAPTTFELPKARKMRAIRIRFAGRTRRTGQVGLAEFVLLPPAKKRRR